MLINHANNSTIWYHTTTNNRVENILKYGLKINSAPTFQSHKEPWIYLSTIPFLAFESLNNITLFGVDCKDIKEEDAGWPFVDDNTPLSELWQLRVFVDIAPYYLKILEVDNIENAIR